MFGESRFGSIVFGVNMDLINPKIYLSKFLI